MTLTLNMHEKLDTTTKKFNQRDIYQCHGINDRNGIRHAAVKEMIRNEYYRSIGLAINRELNVVNMIGGINGLAVPVAT